MNPLLSLTLITFCIFSTTLAANPKEGPTEEALLFLEGFAYGLEEEIGNVTECAKDLNVTMEDLDAGFKLIKHGIPWHPKDLEKGLKLWAAGLTEFTHALKDCGLEHLVEDIEVILKEIESGIGGTLKFLAEEILALIKTQSRKDIVAAYTAWEHGDYYHAGYYSGKVVGIILEKKSENAF
eukprot:TRINITY_DN9990_c0_g1_i1.p1 TRINITY_DN9990_c0_g1~~TRINITY_DN9990_c0_g1_i1.p1  ORF type:complete len:181 (-),score=53.66 TRINITY_DN9990_c0_g1_i1:54-596(-)